MSTFMTVTFACACQAFGVLRKVSRSNQCHTLVPKQVAVTVDAGAYNVQHTQDSRMRTHRLKPSDFPWGLPSIHMQSEQQASLGSARPMHTSGQSKLMQD